MKTTLKAKLKNLEQQFERLLASRPKDPMETNRALVTLLNEMGLSPACIGLDDHGREIAGAARPCPSSIPLNIPVLRFFMLIQSFQEILGLADDPAKVAELEPEMQRALASFDEPTRRSCLAWFGDLLNVHKRHVALPNADVGGRR